MQAVKKFLLVFGLAFDVDSDAAVGIGNPTILLVLSGKTNNERAEAKSLNETFDVDFQMRFVNIEAFCQGDKPSFYLSLR